MARKLSAIHQRCKERTGYCTPQKKKTADLVHETLQTGESKICVRGNQMFTLSKIRDILSGDFGLPVTAEIPHSPHTMYFRTTIPGVLFSSGTETFIDGAHVNSLTSDQALVNYFLHLMDAEVIKKGRKLFRWSKINAKFMEFIYDPGDTGDFEGNILVDKKHHADRSFTKNPHNLEECAMRAICEAGAYPESSIWVIWQGKELYMKSSELMAIVESICELDDRINAVIDLMK